MNRPLLLLPMLLSGLLLACEGDVGPPGPAGSSGLSPDQFDFRSDHISTYVKVDRMGGPATTTALLRPGAAGGSTRQAANLTEPANDAQYAGEYVNTLKTLHYELGPALASLALTPCGVAGVDPASTNVDKCVTQATSVPPAGQPGHRVIPDVLRLDTSLASGFPNGRDLDDQVVDILLAVALLDLTDPAATCFGGPCTARTLANLPLNPGASNPPPLTQFPYFNNQVLAPPPPATPSL